MRVLYCFVLLLCLALFPLFAEIRSLNDIFPELPASVREEAFSGAGYFKSFGKVTSSALFGSPSSSALDPQITRTVLSKQPGFLVESIMVIPYKSGKDPLVDVYNALGNVRGLSGRLYHSFTRKEDIPLFEEVTRIESAKKNVPIADPSPISFVPRSETVYIRLKDVNFGTCFYRGDMTLNPQGLCYSLSNNKSLTYYLVPVIKEEKFIARLYFEPISEGILIYGITGADVSNFVSSRVDMASAIRKRLAVIIDWVVDGLPDKV